MKKYLKWGALPAGLLLSILFLAGANYGRVVFGLSLSGWPIGGQRLSQAEQLLKTKIEAFGQKELVFEYQGKEWKMTPQEMGFSFPLEQNFNQIFSFGREDVFSAGIFQQIRSVLVGENLTLQYQIDSKKFNQSLDAFSEIETKPVNASLDYDASSDSFRIKPAQSGILIDKEKLINGALGNFSQDQNIALILNQTPPTITEKNAAPLIQQAQELIKNAPVFVQSPESTWRIEKNLLANWLTLELDESSRPVVSLDEKKLKDFLATAASAINHQPTNAQLGWKDDRISLIILAREGRQLNEQASIRTIKNAVLAGERNIELAIDKIEPEISNKNIENLGISTLLGRGESNFSGSSKNRIHNLTLGASRLNGLLIKAGEEFSFGQKIGSIDGPSGYLPELVIKNKQTVPEYGGGMCQVSTTLFRAAMDAGLKITERHPHAYPVHYYDPPGFDATVYPPNPDLKFLNDTPDNILLQSKIEGTKLIFEIYGTSDGRLVKIIGPKITHKGTDGSIRTTLSRQIWRGGQMEREDKFPSYYKSADLYPVVKPSLSPSPSPAPSESPAPPTAPGETPQ